jgi:hypothetical protein
MLNEVQLKIVLREMMKSTSLMCTHLMLFIENI